MKQFELKLATGNQVVWEGNDGEDAARRYVASHPDEAVVAWRTYPRFGIFTEDADSIRSLKYRIIEPGHPAWGKR